MKKTFALLTLLTFQAHSAGTLTFLGRPSANGMDLKSPKSYLMSLFTNKLSFDERAMGIVYVDLKCPTASSVTAMVQKSDETLRELMIHGAGLGILFQTSEGELIRTLEFQNLPSVTYKISDAQCARLLTFQKGFTDHKVDHLYGQANRPLWGEGATSVSYAAAHLEVLKALSVDQKNQWVTGLNVPEEIVGPPLKDEGINFLSVVWKGDHWATEKEFHQKLAYWDVDKFTRWLKSRKAEEIDLSGLPTPMGPIWLQHTDPMYQKK